jgi:hypothetical protein
MNTTQHEKPPLPLEVSETVVILRTRDGKLYQQVALYEWIAIRTIEDLRWLKQ